MSNVPAIEVKDLHKKIKNKEIIKGISFETKPGEIFGFLGPNGSGKTTTIRMMCGLFSITAGSIKIQGHSITDEFEQAAANIGVIVEYPVMYSYLTGWQNLKQFARIHNVTDERISQVLAIVKMEKAKNDKFKTYSLGMKQRMGLAQALLHKPSVLILDEPMNGLDPAGIKELRSMLRELAANEGTSVFISSHILSEMEMLCDRVAILDDGRMKGTYDMAEIKKGNVSLEDKFMEVTDNNQL